MLVVSMTQEVPPSRMESAVGATTRPGVPSVTTLVFSDCKTAAALRLIQPELLVNVEL